MNSKSVKILLFGVLTVTLYQEVRCSILPVLRSTDSANNGHYNKSTERRYNSNLGYFSMTNKDVEESRIVGGTYAKSGQFPFMAVVHRLIGQGRVSQCGGSILTSRWVLTAGHCIANFPRKFFVVFGTASKAGIGYDFYNGPGVSMITTQGAIHPEYQQTKNDIGLLFMPRDIPFSSSIRPVRLPNHEESRLSFSNKMSWVIGWGRGESSAGSKNLKYAMLPTISNGECAQRWGITQSNICTAANYGEDACQGDSGGPLLIMQDGRPLQIGVVSYGDKDCPSSKPGVFTRVSEYLPWIEEVTGTSVEMLSIS